jgi:hypothetical protein
VACWRVYMTPLPSHEKGSGLATVRFSLVGGLFGGPKKVSLFSRPDLQLSDFWLLSGQFRTQKGRPTTERPL